MTAVAVPPVSSGTVSHIQWKKVVKLGLVTGTAVLIVIGIGMYETFDARVMIYPFLTLGDMSIMWAPIYYGYRSSQRVVLEGVETVRAGAHSVVSGAVVGLIGGLMVGAFILLADSMDLRGAFINVSPSLIEKLSVGGSAAAGAVAFTIGGTVLGALGGILHLLSSKVRSILGTFFGTIFLFSLFELVVGDVLREAGLGALDRMIYTSSRALKPIPAIIIGSIAVGVRYLFRGRGTNILDRYRGQTSKGKNRWLLVTGLGMIAAGIFLPMLFGTFLNDILANVGLFILLGLGLNIVIGYAGLLDLGYVAFFAIGAYTTAVLTSTRSPMISPEMAFFEALPWVMLMAAIAGLVIGTPVIRMRGDYLAIVTLGFGEIIRFLFISEWMTPVFGGAQGILRISPLDPDSTVSGIRVHMGYALAVAGVITAIIGFLHWREVKRIEGGEVAPVPSTSYTNRKSLILMGGGLVAVVLGMLFPDFWVWTIIGINPADMFRMILVFVALAIFVSWRLRDSRVGRAWIAVREDEQIAQSMGINIVITKLLAFVMGAILASFGGALFAVKIGTIFPNSFEIVQSIIILVVVIVGGMGSIKGVILGAFVLIGILGGPTQPGLLREFGEYKLFAYGVILIWMMLNRPEGLWPEARRARELHQEEIYQDAWLNSAGAEEEEDS